MTCHTPSKIYFRYFYLGTWFKCGYSGEIVLCPPKFVFINQYAKNVIDPLVWRWRLYFTFYEIGGIQIIPFFINVDDAFPSLLRNLKEFLSNFCILEDFKTRIGSLGQGSRNAGDPRLDWTLLVTFSRF